MIWTEIAGSPAWDKSAQKLVRKFDATLNQGGAQAASNGYALGNALTYDGVSLCCTGLAIANAEGKDEVTITWETWQRQDRDSSYNDGVRRYPGEEEWTIETGTDSVELEEGTLNYHSPAIEMHTTNSQGWGDTAACPYVWKTSAGAGSQALMPNAYLVWKKWLLPRVNPLAGGAALARRLPKNKADALQALQTYLPPGNGPYEQNGPCIGKRLGPQGFEAQLLCVDISLDQDGDLVCRTARYKWNPEGWFDGLYL